MSKKSTSVGQVFNKRPVIVNDNAEETNESSSGEMDNEESDVNEEYRNTLEEFNRVRLSILEKYIRILG